MAHKDVHSATKSKDVPPGAEEMLQGRITMKKAAVFVSFLFAICTLSVELAVAQAGLHHRNL